MWVATSADTTPGTTPTMVGSSKVGLTRNLASVSRTVRAPASLAIRQPYRRDASSNDRSVMGQKCAVTADQLALNIHTVGGIERAIGSQLPGGDLRRHRTLEHVAEDPARFMVADAHQRLDPPVKVAVHQDGTTDPELVVAAGPKAQNPRVLKKPAENAAHTHVLR